MPRERKASDVDAHVVHFLQVARGAADEEVREAGRDAAVHDRGRAAVARECLELQGIFGREGDVGDRLPRFDDRSQHGEPEGAGKGA